MIHSNPDLQKKLLLAIKKSQGTLENVTKMIEANEACGDIGHQLSSAIGLLRSASIDLMKNHLICCGTTALSHKNPKKVMNSSKNLLVYGMSLHGNSQSYPHFNIAKPL